MNGSPLNYLQNYFASLFSLAFCFLLTNMQSCMCQAHSFKIHSHRDPAMYLYHQRNTYAQQNLKKAGHSNDGFKLLTDQKKMDGGLLFLIYIII